MISERHPPRPGVLQDVPRPDDHVEHRGSLEFAPVQSAVFGLLFQGELVDESGGDLAGGEQVPQQGLPPQVLVHVGVVVANHEVAGEKS